MGQRLVRVRSARSTLGASVTAIGSVVVVPTGSPAVISSERAVSVSRLAVSVTGISSPVRMVVRAGDCTTDSESTVRSISRVKRYW